MTNPCLPPMHKIVEIADGLLLDSICDLYKVKPTRRYEESDDEFRKRIKQQLISEEKSNDK